MWSFLKHMKNSIYKDYIAERQKCKFLESPEGFATYSVGDNFYYIQDVYIKPECRGSGASHKLAKEIELMAKECGCKVLKTTINLWQAGKNYSNLYAILNYGFDLISCDRNVMYFEKRL